MEIILNGKALVVPKKYQRVTLQSFVRDVAGLKGTKFGCGGGFCGACTVHVDGEAVRSCQIEVGGVLGQNVTTIEGLAGSAGTGDLHPVQKAWIENDVPQCGFCQAGQIMTAAALLNRTPHPSDEDIRDEMSGNLCRCGTYGRIRQAIASVTGGA